MVVSKKEKPIHQETEIEDDEIPTPWESVFCTLLEFLSEDLAFDAACAVCDDLNMVMRQIPRPGNITHVAIVACHPSEDEAVEWQHCVLETETWY